MSNEHIGISVVLREGTETRIEVPLGKNLREALMDAELSPYQGPFKSLNCQGLGVCGTCKVWVRENGEDWERRSCQIQCFQDLEIRLQ